MAMGRLFSFRHNIVIIIIIVTVAVSSAVVVVVVVVEEEELNKLQANIRYRVPMAVLAVVYIYIQCARPLAFNTFFRHRVFPLLLLLLLLYFYHYILGITLCYYIVGASVAVVRNGYAEINSHCFRTRNAILLRQRICNNNDIICRYINYHCRRDLVKF